MTVFTLALAWEASVDAVATLPGSTLSIPTFVSDENDELHMHPDDVAAMHRERAQWEDRERALDPETALTAPRVRGQPGGPRGAWGLGASVSEPGARTVRATAVRPASGAWALPGAYDLPEVDLPESSDLLDERRPELDLDELDLPDELPELESEAGMSIDLAAGKWHFFEAGMAGLLRQHGTVTTPRYKGNGYRSRNKNTWTVTSVEYQRDESEKVVGGVVGMTRKKQNSAKGFGTKSELIYFGTGTDGTVEQLLDGRTGKTPKFWLHICPIPGSKRAGSFPAYAQPDDWAYSSSYLSGHSQY